MKFPVVLAIAIIASVPAFAQQVVMPAAGQQQQRQLSPIEAADEQIILQLETSYRDAFAQALSLDAQTKALTKQNAELLAKAVDSDKKLADDNAQINELKGRIDGLEKEKAAKPAAENRRPQMSAMPSTANLAKSPKGLKPGEYWNNGGLISVVPDETK